MTRWTLVVSDDTDRSLRAYLGQLGAKKRRPIQIRRGGCKGTVIQ